MSDSYYQPGMKFQRDDPFDTNEDEPAALPSVESLEPTGDPFMDSCLLGQHHNWYHRTYDAYPVYDDGTPWWQDYLDDAERFGCGSTDSSGKPRSKVAAIAALLKENNISKTSASQQSPLPLMRAYYRARAFAYTEEHDQMWASLRRLKNLTRNHAVFAKISKDLVRQDRLDESYAVAEFEKN